MFPAVTNAKGRSSAERDVHGELPVVEESAETAPWDPLVNVSDNRQIEPGTACSRVRVQNMKPANTNTCVCVSQGSSDDAGDGVANGQTRGGARIRIGSSRVFFEGAPAAHRGSAMQQNGLAHANAPHGAQDQPSQSLLYVSP
ncbi:MAG: PAAR-like domain-containing protein [Puniceicoccales bacterium]